MAGRHGEEQKWNFFCGLHNSVSDARSCVSLHYPPGIWVSGWGMDLPDGPPRLSFQIDVLSRVDVPEGRPFPRWPTQMAIIDGRRHLRWMPRMSMMVFEMGEKRMQVSRLDIVQYNAKNATSHHRQLSAEPIVPWW